METTFETECLNKADFHVGEVTTFLNSAGADFIRFADLRSLSEKQNRGFPRAILFGIGLYSADELCPAPLEQNLQGILDQFHRQEEQTDRMADELAAWLTEKGYQARSQSEKQIGADTVFNFETKSSVLPHKTIALLAGLGPIGKSNLLLHPKFGSAFSMCTVLTDAPLETTQVNSVTTNCGECMVCREICPRGVIHGCDWQQQSNRDLLVNVFECIPCLKCMVYCPLSKRYLGKKFESGRSLF